jgi:predicted AAA+ superfamily ATPase
MEWLTSSGMVLRCAMVSLPQIPLKGFEADGYFKLYLSDSGLLCNQIALPYQQILLDRDFFYKGIIVENYVATQLVAAKVPLFYWRDGNTAEVDFLFTGQNGIVPVEVKAGRNKASSSMRRYRERFSPSVAVRISARNFGSESGIRSIPLYALFCLG